MQALIKLRDTLIISAQNNSVQAGTVVTSLDMLSLSLGTIEMAQSYPPSKVVERFVDSPFWQSCGKVFKILSLSKVVEKIMKVVENFLWSKRKLWKIESCGNFPQLSYLFSTTLICIFHNFRIFGLKSPKFSPAALQKSLSKCV